MDHARMVEGKTAVVTGAGGGIGAALAAQLVAAGARVVVTDVDPVRADAVAHRVGATARTVDVTDPAAMALLSADTPTASLVFLVPQAVTADGATAQADPIKGQGVERDTPFNVRGTASATATPLAGGNLVDGSGPITCLDIRGNTAGVTVHLTQSKDPALVGRDAYGTFIDGGPGGVDYGGFIPGLGPVAGCASHQELAKFPFTRGGLVLKDGKHPVKK